MARYDSNTKTQRNQALVDYAGAHPDLAMKEIALVFNISKQRVFQILSKGKRDDDCND